MKKWGEWVDCQETCHLLDISLRTHKRSVTISASDVADILLVIMLETDDIYACFELTLYYDFRTRVFYFVPTKFLS